MFRVLLIGVIAACLLAPATPVNRDASADEVHAEFVVAEVVLAKTRHLAAPRGRVRKRVAHPSLGPMPKGVGGGGGRVHRRQAFRWFWGEVSTSITAASQNRWSEVMTVIETGRSRGRAVYGTRATAVRILNAYKEFLIAEARRRNVSLPLLIAVIAVESNGRAAVVSPKGAGGLMQLMPGTATRFGVSDRFMPSQNIRGGARYLDWLLRRFKGDAVLALAGYNAGEGAVDQHNGVPPYAETRDYVAMVAGAYAAARMLCSTPPRSPRGVCILK